MDDTSVFDIPMPGLLGGAYLAEVIDVADPQGLGRVRVRLLNADGIGDHDGPIWARVAVPFAGDGYGAYMLPDVGEQVLATFVHGDMRMPVIIGALYHGSATPPERVGGSGDRVDRWTMTGKEGTRIAIVEENGGSTIELETANGVSGTFTDSGGGSITLRAGGSTFTLDGQGAKVQTGAKVVMKASLVEIEAGMVKVNSAFSQFQGLVQVDTLLATTVVSSTYTPGAGNIW